MFCLELCYSGGMYRTRCGHSVVSLGNNIFPNGIMKLKQGRRFIFPDWNHKDGSLNFLFLFLAIYLGFEIDV
jgi:hypothetical protein